MKYNEITNTQFFWPLRIYKTTHPPAIIDKLKHSWSTISQMIMKESQKNISDKIKHFIEEREHNYKNNQRKMINSLLNKEFRKITLDRLTYIDEHNSENFTTDQTLIEKLSIDHYQNIGGMDIHPFSFRHTQTIPDEWKEFYDPRPNISAHNSNNLLKDITQSEYYLVVRSLPNNKATGPSTISYEMIKNLSDEMHNIIISLFNQILNKGIVPDQWLKALIYPIPKPKDWDCQLNNTRPITLLECIRKVFVKIINNRVNNFLTDNKILQHNNQAGIKGTSTAEIIASLQTLMEYQKVNQDQELFIVLQDLSKAYDRVDISLLYHALIRVNIPSHLANLITQLFTDRTNNIIMDTYLSNEYNVLQGIDQGETISPILWVIYYDPLFQKINELHDGYTITTSTPKNIYNKESNYTITTKHNLNGYLDDMTWFNNSLHNTVRNLSIADSFYNFANIKINKEKTKILTNSKKILKEKSIDLQFGNELIKIDITPKHVSERILGVYINMNNSNQFVIKKITRFINFISNSLKYKPITHDMITYIYKVVLFPRIEYLSQNIFISQAQCEKWDITIRNTIKHNLALSKSTYNNIIHSDLIIDIPKIFDHLLKCYISKFITFLNMDATCDIMLQRIHLNQISFGYTKLIPDCFSKLAKPLRSFNQTDNLLFYTLI